MKGKSSIKKAAALLMGVAMAIGGVGCGNFILTDSNKDLAQTVATVNISGSLKATNSGYADVADGVAAVVDKLSTDITKRDLVSYFLGTGYQYVEQYGYTYKDTFNMLINGLIQREILMQYAIAYYLKNESATFTAAKCSEYITAQLNATQNEKEKELLTAHPEVLTLKYFLTDGGNDNKEYDLAVYSLKKSLNDSLDSLEANYIKAESDDHDHGDTRTLPTGVDTEKEDYVPENYGVYTGRNTKDGVGGYGDYEKVDGSTTSTRQKAYNAFLANLQGYNLISTSGKTEDTSKVELLDYYYVELSSILGQSLINKYYETLEDKVVAMLEDDTLVDPDDPTSTISYVEKKYKEILVAQQKKYSVSPSEFLTAMDSVSDTSFLLYGLENFGYVYNILLPFSATQNIAYTTAKNNKANSQNDLYNIRKALLSEVKGKDLRGSWISEHDHANYSDFTAPTDATTEEYTGEIKFFADNLSESTKYEKLKQYAGNYAYNGKMVKKDDEWVAKPNSVTIDEFITLFESYVGTTAGVTVTGRNGTSYTETDYDAKVKAEDYSQFIYYQGEVEFATPPNAKDYFVEGSTAYKAVSAVNELMFAYSTDTGCLNTYLGYSVSPYETSFVPEFAYAAREAIKGGAGTYVVCATDYGWHIVYASFVYDDGEVYGGYKADEAHTEGTFSYLFYESLKESALSNYSTEEQNTVLNSYNNSESVTKYESRYKDLLELDS